MNNSTMSVGMTPWLHFGHTDYLIFKAWRPSSPGATAATCIALFLFCVLERFLAALRRTQELRWRTKITPTLCKTPLKSDKEDCAELPREDSISTRRRLFHRFTPSCDIPRGGMQAIQSTFSYALMLAVMTFNAAYILSIILGLGVGEVVFGRVGRRQEVE